MAGLNRPRLTRAQSVVASSQGYGAGAPGLPGGGVHEVEAGDCRSCTSVTGIDDGGHGNLHQPCRINAFVCRSTGSTSRVEKGGRFNGPHQPGAHPVVSQRIAEVGESLLAAHPRGLGGCCDVPVVLSEASDHAGRRS
jgi:hypothetical protein